MRRLLIEDRPDLAPSDVDTSYDADPQGWLARNADTVRQAFAVRTHHVLTCSDPVESPWGTIALPGLGILRTRQSLERVHGLHCAKRIDTIRSHTQCKACAAFAREKHILPEYADETGMILGEIMADQTGAGYEHSVRTPHYKGPVNNLYVDPTLCLGNPEDGGLPPGFKVSQLPLNSWWERRIERGVTDPTETYEHVRLLTDVVAAGVPKDGTRDPFNVVLFRDPDAFDDSEELAKKLRSFGIYAHRPWQRYVEAWAPKRRRMQKVA